MATSSPILTPETVKAPQIIVPIHAAPMTPEKAAKGERTVTMVFDKPVHLTLDTNKSVFYPVGPQEVPVRYSDHWYLKAHGVKRYAKPIAVSEQQGSQKRGGQQRGK